ncbi:MAG TPA: helix-hairpin-helix domain-containing protein [Myxococcales bacterium]|jgi:competence protein ComEA
MGTDGGRGARPRALAGLLALTIGWALWGSLEANRPPLPCDRPVSDPRRPERVTCSLEPSAGPAGRAPLGVQRALGLPPGLNSLTAEDFASLPGVGARLAERIVEARRQQGGFQSIDDLGKVKGVGPAKLATLRAALEPPRR